MKLASFVGGIEKKVGIEQVGIENDNVENYANVHLEAKKKHFNLTCDHKERLSFSPFSRIIGPFGAYKPLWMLYDLFIFDGLRKKGDLAHLAMATWSQNKLGVLMLWVSIAIAIVFGLRRDYCDSQTKFGNGN